MSFSTIWEQILFGRILQFRARQVDPRFGEVFDLHFIGVAVFVAVAVESAVVQIVDDVAARVRQVAVLVRIVVGKVGVEFSSRVVAFFRPQPVVL